MRSDPAAEAFKSRLAKVFSGIRQGRESVDCQEEIEKETRLLREAAARRLANGFLPHLEACGVPPRHVEVFNSTLKKAQPLEDVKNFLSSGRATCLFFGRHGNGKTIAAVYALRQSQRIISTHPHAKAKEPIQLQVWDSPNGLFVTEEELRQAPRWDDTRMTKLERALFVNWLVVDEFGKAVQDSKWPAILEDLLIRRHAAGKKTFLTSNFSTQEELAAYAGPAVSDRWRENAEWIECRGLSLRHGHLESIPGGLQ